MADFVDSFHQITISIINQLIAFLQLKYRANDQEQTPLTTQPITMLVALSSFLVYYLLHVVLLRFPRPSRFAAVAECFLVWSGYTAVATLAAIVFPQGASRFLYAIFVSLSAAEVLRLRDENLVTEDEVEIKDDDVVEIEAEVKVDVKEDEASKFEVYRKRVCQCLKHLYYGAAARLFQKQIPPIPT